MSISVSTQSSAVGSKRRAAGGGSFLIPSLSSGVKTFPFNVDRFPIEDLRVNARFRPLLVKVTNPASVGP